MAFPCLDTSKGEQQQLPQGPSKLLAQYSGSRVTWCHVQAALPGAEYAIDRSEASPSADGNRYCWFVRDANDEVLGLMTYDVAPVSYTHLTLPTNREV